MKTKKIKAPKYFIDKMTQADILAQKALSEYPIHWDRLIESGEKGKLNEYLLTMGITPSQQRQIHSIVKLRFNLSEGAWAELRLRNLKSTLGQSAGLHYNRKTQELEIKGALSLLGDMLKDFLKEKVGI